MAVWKARSARVRSSPERMQAATASPLARMSARSLLGGPTAGQGGGLRLKEMARSSNRSRRRPFTPFNRSNPKSSISST